MEAQVTAEILRELVKVPDPRTANRYHKLVDILTIALFAVIAGADGWVQVASYGQRKKRWLKTFLELPHGIPSHDTFGRVFAGDLSLATCQIAAGGNTRIELSLSRGEKSRPEGRPR